MQMVVPVGTVGCCVPNGGFAWPTGRVWSFAVTVSLAAHEVTQRSESPTPPGRSESKTSVLPSDDTYGWRSLFAVFTTAPNRNDS